MLPLAQLLQDPFRVPQQARVPDRLRRPAGRGPGSRRWETALDGRGRSSWSITARKPPGATGCEPPLSRHAAPDGETDPRGSVATIEQVANLQRARPDRPTIATEPIECRRAAYPPDQADNLRRPRRRRAFTTALPPRLLIRFRNPCRLARRRTFGWYVRFTTAPPCAGPTRSCRNEGSDRSCPRRLLGHKCREGRRFGPVRQATRLDRFTLRRDGMHHNRPRRLTVPARSGPDRAPAPCRGIRATPSEQPNCPTNHRIPMK